MTDDRYVPSSEECSVVNHLIDKFYHNLGKVSYEAGAELDKIDKSVITRVLIDNLSSHDTEVRLRSLQWLVEHDPVMYSRHALSFLKHPNDRDRWFACGILYDSGYKDSTQELIDVLANDPQPDIRIIAAAALGNNSGEEVRSALEQAQKHDQGIDDLGYSVSQAASDALAKMRSVA